MRRYAVKSVFGPTVQGEGSLVGAVTAFVRLAGCNVWDGRPESRASSRCPYCDTDFVGGEHLTAAEIVGRLRALLPAGGLVTVSGGEPLLQLDEGLAAALRDEGFRLAVETNGTRSIGVGLASLISHVTMSPKVPPGEVRLGACDDLKVLVPHPDPRITPEAFDSFPARQRWCQPVNDPRDLTPASVALALEACYRMARLGRDWRLSVQLHKILGVE